MNAAQLHEDGGKAAPAETVMEEFFRNPGFCRAEAAAPKVLQVNFGTSEI